MDQFEWKKTGHFVLYSGQRGQRVTVVSKITGEARVADVNGGRWMELAWKQMEPVELTPSICARMRYCYCDSLGGRIRCDLCNDRRSVAVIASGGPVGWAKVLPWEATEKAANS